MYAHAQAPVRIGIAGGGTDLPAWTQARIGFCLSLAIRTYTHAVVITRPDQQVVAAYTRLDRAACATEIANGLVRESALLHGFEDGFEVHTLSEVPSHGSGLGVSSSIAVSLGACFARMRELTQGDETADRLPLDREQIARRAWTVEIERLRRPIGRQDHMAAAHGGLRLYRFEGDRAHVERTFLTEDAVWVARHVAIVPLEIGHDARAILSGATDISALRVAYESVDVALGAIERRDTSALGAAVSAGQKSKRGIPGAVPREIAVLVESVEASVGVRGCKVAGAGGGGHLVVVLDDVEERAENLRLRIGLPVLRVEPDLVGVRSEGWS